MKDLFYIMEKEMSKAVYYDFTIRSTLLIPTNAGDLVFKI